MIARSGPGTIADSSSWKSAISDSGSKNGWPDASSAETPYSGISNRNASLLCYIPLVGWIFAIVILASARFRREYDVRFDAFQGLYLFVVWLIVNAVVSPFLRFPGLGPHVDLAGLPKLVVIIVWIFMLVKVSQGERYSLPIVGELADRSVREQV